MELFFALTVAVIIPSVFGAYSYAVMRHGQSEPIRLYIGLFLTILLHFWYIAFFSRFGISVMIFIPSALTCVTSFVGGWAHEKLYHEDSSANKCKSFLVLLTATSFSLFLGVVYISISGAFFLGNYPRNLASWCITLYWISLLTSPSVAPLLLWMRQDMELRPGVDKHLES